MYLEFQQLYNSTKNIFLYDIQNNNENLFNLHFQTKNKLYQKTEISIQ